MGLQNSLPVYTKDTPIPGTFIVTSQYSNSDKVEIKYIYVLQSKQKLRGKNTAWLGQPFFVTD